MAHSTIDWNPVTEELPEAHPSTGTEDDDDDPGDEHPGENEALERAVDETTEAPEEFEVDDEDEPMPAPEREFDD